MAEGRGGGEVHLDRAHYRSLDNVVAFAKLSGRGLPSILNRPGKFWLVSSWSFF